MKFTADELIAKIHAQIDSGAYDTKYSKETLKTFTSIFVQEVIYPIFETLSEAQTSLISPEDTENFKAFITKLAEQFELHNDNPNSEQQEVTTEERPHILRMSAVRSGRLKPQQYISPNTKASNCLFDDDNDKYYQGMRWLSVEGKKSKKDISVSLFVKYDECINTGLEVFMPHENQILVLFDRNVHDAIVAHILNGSNDISTNMIYQVISGNSEGLSSENPVPKSLSKAISESITRLFHSWVEIDATEQAKAYGFDDGVFKGHLLTGSIVEASLNGNITTCVHIAEIPILYRYADKCGQVIRYDVKALNVPDLENSVENIATKTYLLQQIKIMTNTKDYSRTMCFDTLFKLLNVQATSEGALRKKKMQIRDHVIKCLDYWATEKIIPEYSGYTLNRKGRAIVSVTLRVKLSSKPTIKKTNVQYSRP